MSDAVRILDEEGYPIQEGNPLPVDAGSSSTLTKEISKINEDEPLFSKVLDQTLGKILKELQKINMHLSLQNDVYIQNKDIFN